MARYQAQLWSGPDPSHTPRLPEGSSLRVGVVGGGLAGVAAAAVLAERGAKVTVFEKEPQLGGRVSAWPDALADGESFQMERGFHAFFRHYYNVRRFLRRIDPELSFLMPCEDYPLLGPDGRSESFAKLPKRPPFNLMAVVWRTPTMRVWEALKVDRRAALQMLAFDMEQTYAQWDGENAADYLDSLGFPGEARQMLFDIFAHSFFNPQEEFSAAELLMMFHYYFLGNPEGIVFDVLRDPFSTAVWEPLSRYLTSCGVDLRTETAVEKLEKRDSGWCVNHVTASGARDTTSVDALVLSTAVPSLQKLLETSPDLSSPEFDRQVGSLDVTSPFAVWRLWYDQRENSGRAPFAGTTGVGMLDNISLYHLFEDESRRWSERTGGSVVELHAYAVPRGLGEKEIKEDLIKAFWEFYPEYRDATPREERFLLRRDCPAFAPGSWENRPTVATSHDSVYLAGDFVKLPFPTALMERAVTSGTIAANHILESRGVQAEEIWTIPPRGMFAPRRAA